MLVEEQCPVFTPVMTFAPFRPLDILRQVTNSQLDMSFLTVGKCTLLYLTLFSAATLFYVLHIILYKNMYSPFNLQDSNSFGILPTPNCWPIWQRIGYPVHGHENEKIRQISKFLSSKAEKNVCIPYQFEPAPSLKLLVIHTATTWGLKQINAEKSSRFRT